MIVRERKRYHQLHPAKLLTNWVTAIVAGAVLWRHQLLAAFAIGVGPSIVMSLLFLSGRFDRALEAIRSKPVAQTIAPWRNANVKTSAVNSILADYVLP